jgi:hypothetical protein
MSWAEEQDWFGLEDLVLTNLETEQFMLENQVWETQNGDLVKIKDMSTNHIKSCIRLIKKYQWRTQFLEAFTAELSKRNST